MSKLLKEQWAKLAFGQKEQKLNEMALDPMDRSSLHAVCRDSFEHDTLFKVQGVILEGFPDCDTGDIAATHTARLSESFNGIQLNFEQLQDLVCEWMIDYAQACTDGRMSPPMRTDR